MFQKFLGSYIRKKNRGAQLTLGVSLSWSVFLWCIAGHKWARRTKSQQCLTTQAVRHHVHHLIKPITLHLLVLLRGRVQAIWSVFRSMKLDMNLHFWANSFNVTHCNEQEEIIEKPKSETTLSELQLNYFPQPLDKRHNRVFIVREIAPTTSHLDLGLQ